jgi:RNA polymerase sigma-70 factor (ECF subfamily)
MQEVIDFKHIAIEADIILLDEFAIDITKEQAFAKIVDKYKKRLYWQIRRMVISHDDADDILQETLIKAWRYLPNFRRDSSLHTWLYKIATNCSLTFLKNQKIKLSRTAFVPDNYLENAVRASTNFDANALEWKLQLDIQSLPEKQKAVFNLRYYDEMPYDEMSEVLETSVGALKASYHHAAKKIEDFFTGY